MLSSNNKVPCPKQPISNTIVIVIVILTCGWTSYIDGLTLIIFHPSVAIVLLTIVGFFLFKIFRRKREQTYKHLSTPLPGALIAQAVTIPGAPSEMGYAGRHPEVPYVAPQETYKALQYPSYAPEEVRQLSPTPSAYTLSPPHAAATIYGYSPTPV